MKLPKRQPTGREKDQENIKHLEQLRQKLHSAEVSSAKRLAALDLSWMQEDGLEIFEEALFSNASRKTKNAACYGLRKMHGRMRQKALKMLEKGAKAKNIGTKEMSRHALQILEEQKQGKGKRRSSRGRFRIKEIPRHDGKRRPAERYGDTKKRAR